MLFLYSWGNSSLLFFFYYYYNYLSQSRLTNPWSRNRTDWVCPVAQRKLKFVVQRIFRDLPS